MAVWTQMPLEHVFDQGRWDAEYFQPAYLAIATKLESSENPRLGSLAHLTCSAFYPSATDYYQETGIPFVRCVDVNNYPLIRSGQPFERLPEEFVRLHKSIRTAQSGDIVISKVGSPCFASIIDESVGEVALTRTVLALRKIRAEKINPYYLVAFLRSKYGFFQLLREREQQIQFQLTLDRVRKIRVFLPRRQLQEEIGGLIKSYGRALSRANENYAYAQRVLLDELGLDRIDLSHRVGYETRLSETLQARRWDAQHYRQKYKALLDTIRKAPSYRILKDIATYNQRGLQPEYVSDGPIAVVNSQHIGLQHLAYDQFEKTSEVSFATALPARIRKNDILVYTTGAYVGRTNVFLEDRRALASNHVNIIRIRPEYDAAYVGLVMNSPVGLLQTEKHATGSTQAELYPSAIAKFLIPILKPKIMTGVGDKVRGSHLALVEAKQLLEQAKRRVEELIEQNTEA